MDKEDEVKFKRMKFRIVGTTTLVLERFRCEICHPPTHKPKERKSR